jgi:hypothetical protein
MKKVAILVIASVQSDTYRIYIREYWSKMIKYTKEHVPNLDIFLLFDYDTDISKNIDIHDNIIIDYNDNYNGYAPNNLKCNGFIPGILSKTIYAFKKLQNEYDIFFRTNLSSMIVIKNFINYIENNEIIYSGFYIWHNALRNDLLYHKKIGDNKSIKSLDELKDYPGNTFISGSGYFLNSKEVKEITKNEDKIRYDIIDDVSVGLMIKDYNRIKSNYHLCLRSSNVSDNVIQRLQTNINKGTFHIRLQHFPAKIAEEFHRLLDENNMVEKFH